MIGTVQGDIHDIGKNVVILLLKAAGFEITDLGTDVTSSKFTDEVKEEATRRGLHPWHVCFAQCDHA